MLKKREWDRPVNMAYLSVSAMSYLTIAMTVFQLTWSHPQCLDFYPPFTPSQDLAFCGEYSDFGCCTITRDVELSAEFGKIARDLAPLSTECKNYLREILCQECSPYASHIFDAEVTQRRTPLPGLCISYCLDFAQKCARVVRLITSDEEILSALEVSAEYFCFKLRVGDVDYCYPDVLYYRDIKSEPVVADGGSSEGCLCVEDFAYNLRNPLAAVHAGDGSHRLFVAEQRGKVFVFLRNGTKVTEPFLDMEDAVLVSSRRGDERGFLGIAFHPKYKENGRFFVYYSVMHGTTHRIRISEMRVLDADPNRADPTFERILLDIDEPAANHNGGQILFGDDGFMYLFIGDGGRGGDPFGIMGNGQNLKTLLGSVLRIDVDSQENGLPYGIPPDNPFIHVRHARDEIYAYGARNMWRCSVDRGDLETEEGKGRIFCGDVGQNKYEEIDIIVRGGNYGWRGKEGFKCYDSDMCTDDYMGGEIDPIHAYPHSVGKCVIGGYVYRGCESPNLRGHYIFGDFDNGKLFKLTENKESGTWDSHNVCMGDESICNNGLIGSYPIKILSFGEDESGELYILSTDYESSSGYGGKVMKIVDPSRRGDPEKCQVDRSGDNGPTPDFEYSQAGKFSCPSRCPRFKTKLISQVICKADYALRIRVISNRWYGPDRFVTAELEAVYRLHTAIAKIDTTLYFWVEGKAAHCDCPRLRPGKTYFIVGEYDFERYNFLITEGTLARRWISGLTVAVRSKSADCVTDPHMSKAVTYNDFSSKTRDLLINMH